jgi:hypothetical protein
MAFVLVRMLDLRDVVLARVVVSYVMGQVVARVVMYVIGQILVAFAGLVEFRHYLFAHRAVSRVKQSLLCFARVWHIIPLLVFRPL